MKGRNILNSSPVDKNDETKTLAIVSLVMIPRTHYLLTDFTPSTTTMTMPISSTRKTSFTTISTLITKTTIRATSKTTTSSTIRVTTSTTTNCSDGNKYCGYWAKTGECQKNPDYMRLECRKACGLCELSDHVQSSTTCRDTNHFCSSWAKQGECKINPGYMNVNCCDSCRGMMPSGTTGICQDRNQYCTSWSYQGDL